MPRRADALGLGEQVLIYAILAAVSVAYNYSFILIDYVRPYLVQHGGMTLRDTAWLYTAQGSGVIIGSFLTPVLVSRFHAKPVLVASLLALAPLTACTVILGSFPVWVISRFLAGITLAGSFVSSTTMLNNLFPPHLRGRLLSINAAMFSTSLLLIGGLGALVGEPGWRSLIIVGGAGPLIVAVVAMVMLPSDEGLLVYADEEVAVESTSEKGSWREMLSGRRLRLTLVCLMLAGLNFSGYQFYSGFITTYLVSVRHFSPTVTATFVMIDGIGTLIGTLFWGWLADRKGRRANAVGFALAAVFIIAFLVAPVVPPVLMLIELSYAICLSCTYMWGAYFAELFPVRLRPMGASLVHGGHTISLFAPLLITVVAAHASLALGMSLAPASFALGAILWWTLPETLRTARGFRGFQPEQAR